MNTILPAPRDLPPGRQSAIRAELQRTVEGLGRRRRYAPMIAATAALGVIAAVAVVVPWNQGGANPPAGSATTTLPTSESSTPKEPVIPGISAERRAEIEKGCATSASVTGGVRLYNLLNDEGGQFALLYGEDSRLDCTLDEGGMPYNSGFGATQHLGWLPGPFSVDHLGARAGGDLAGGKPQYAGIRGSQVAAGRVSSEVARVTYTEGDVTVDAVLANGTYVARILHSADWLIPDASNTAVLEAYDAEGKLLATHRPGPAEPCYAKPDKVIVYPAFDNRDPATCLPAVPWR